MPCRYKETQFKKWFDGTWSEGITSVTYFRITKLRVLITVELDSGFQNDAFQSACGSETIYPSHQICAASKKVLSAATFWIVIASTVTGM